jgi:hypothetical protein
MLPDTSGLVAVGVAARAAVSDYSCHGVPTSGGDQISGDEQISGDR